MGWSGELYALSRKLFWCINKENTQQNNTPLSEKKTLFKVGECKQYNISSHLKLSASRRQKHAYNQIQ